MFEIKFIKNSPTLENLRSLYESDSYQNLLSQFENLSKHKLDNRKDDNMRLINLLNIIQRRYVILNIPFDEVLQKFEENKKDLLVFTIISCDFFIKLDDDTDGEFSKGEEPDKEDKSTLIESFGISKTFFLDKFCELYLLKSSDGERLLHYLKTTRMPQAKKYAGQIAKLYKQL